MDTTTGIFFWGFMVVYGIVMFAISPKTVTIGGFFKGEDRQGRAANPWMIMASIFIAWIFAKSVTNCANMGMKFGIVGGIGYAVYWLCIPLTGYAIYRLRRRFGATSMTDFLTKNYGIAAAFCFSAAILVRLFNEVWSNTSVIGEYYGASGSAPFVLAACLFTAITVAYCCWGGMRSSLITDVAQAVLFAVLLIVVCCMVIPQDGVAAIATSGVWTLEGGVDFIIGAGLQCLSYGFHDAVLTDRGFICEEKKMLKAFTVAGLLGFVAIVLFSTIGVHVYLNESLQGLGSSAPVVVAQSLSTLAFFLMSVIMISCAGSTLDSTFSSLSKLTARDLPGILGKKLQNPRMVGIAFIVIFAIVGYDHGRVDYHCNNDFGHHDHGLRANFPAPWCGSHQANQSWIHACVLDRYDFGHLGCRECRVIELYEYRHGRLCEFPGSEFLGSPYMLGRLYRAGIDCRCERLQRYRLACMEGSDQRRACPA